MELVLKQYFLISVFQQQMTQVFSLQHFLNVNMRGKVILNILIPPFSDEYKIKTYKVKYLRSDKKYTEYVH